MTTTDSTGHYSFTNLAAGTYEVQFIAPTGKQFTAQGAGGNASLDSNANQTTGISAQVTLTAGQTDNTIDAGLVAIPPAPAALGDYVWCDTNGNGVQDAAETGLAGVTVDLLNATGTSVLAMTTTDSTGHYSFTNLAAGTYEVQFIAPTGKTFTGQGLGGNAATDSNANKTTGITGPITLQAGQTDNTIDAGLVSNTGISVNKIPGKEVVNSCGQVTYQFDVRNTGSAPITNISIKDNIGTAAKPDYITPSQVMVGKYNTGDTNHNGALDTGETWKYQVTNTPIQNGKSICGTVSHTCTGSYLGSGNTAWFSCSFTPTTTKDGTCYVFKGVHAKLSGGGVGSSPRNVDCPDSEVRFSSSCTKATTTHDAARNCWVTTLPANCAPGAVFMTGIPVTVPSGSNFTNANCQWTVDNSSNNCGSASVNLSASCKGYSSFAQNGIDGHTDYNAIGVKVCDSTGEYGNGGSVFSGYGWCNGSYANSGWGGMGTNSYGWVGSSKDCAGTPENIYTSNACGSKGYSGGYGKSGGCGTGSATVCTQTQLGATGVSDTVTVTGTSAGATVTASDTAEVFVIDRTNKVSVDGATPTGDMKAMYGKAQTLEFTYNAGDVVSTRAISAGSCDGHNANPMAFVEITNNANPFAANAQVYFKGMVTSGEKLFADASINSLTNTQNTGVSAFMSTAAGQGIHAFIFNSEAGFKAGAAPIQTGHL